MAESQSNRFCIHLFGVECHRLPPTKDPITNTPVYLICRFDLYCHCRSITPDDIITRSFQDRLQQQKQVFLEKNPLQKHTLIDTLVDAYRKRNPHDLRLSFSINKDREGIPDGFLVSLTGSF